MADNKILLFPSALEQNPAPVNGTSQDRKQKISDQVEEILKVFYQLVPSNYVSTVKGPHYTLQFQAVAEQIAAIQIDAQEVFADSFLEFTRPEFLYQIIGNMVFPDGKSNGTPTIPGDVTYRDFMQNMVKLLLAGATKANIVSGLELLTAAEVQVIERGVWARKMGSLSGWGPDDQHVFEINILQAGTPTSSSGQLGPGDSTTVGFVSGYPLEQNYGEVSSIATYTFPDDPFTLQENVRIVMRALKPAHTLYEYRHLFLDAFGPLFTESMSWEITSYYYEDFRKYCLGARYIAGTSGDTLTDRTLFSDPARDFSSIQPGAQLVVTSGVNSIHAGGAEGTIASTDRRNIGRYRVTEILYFPVGDDATARAYTTSSGLSGTLTIVGSEVYDPNQDFGSALEGELLTILAGPNAGTYRLKTLSDTYGGPVGLVIPPVPHSYTRARIAPSLLRIDQRMPQAATGQAYEVTVDRLGVQTTRTVVGEDVTQFFIQ